MEQEAQRTQEQFEAQQRTANTEAAAKEQRDRAFRELVLGRKRRSLQEHRSRGLAADRPHT
jgi:hypothetical protein